MGSSPIVSTGTPDVGACADRLNDSGRHTSSCDPGRMTDRAFPIISVEDLPATREFYERLGFTQTYQFPPNGEPGFVTMERGGSSIGIGVGGAADVDRFGFWVYVDDVDIALAQLAAAGAPIVAEPEDQPWGERVARTRDPGGNLIYLGSAI